MTFIFLIIWFFLTWNAVPVADTATLKLHISVSFRN
jgi:hypothetical protein